MRSATQPKTSLGMTTLGLLLLSSATAFADVPIPYAEPVPYVETGDPTTRDMPFLAWHTDLSVDGYTEEEFLISSNVLAAGSPDFGSLVAPAHVYEYMELLDADPANDNDQNPDVGIVSSGQYTSRVLIRKPANPANFNGVVYMEILNATAKHDGAPMWNITYPSIMADGAAWVGVTYSELSAIFLTDYWGVPHTFCPDRDPNPSPCGAKLRNANRYNRIDIPLRNYTWDILNHTAALLKADTLSSNPMMGYDVDTIIATGYSQSAAFVTTYANSFYPSYSELAPCTPELGALGQCNPIVNGYIVAAGGPGSRKLDGFKSNTIVPPGEINPSSDRRNCENARNRAAQCDEDGVEVDSTQHPDLPKIIRFTTESDIKSVRVRQDAAEGLAVADYDQPNLRTYESAGTSHVDFWHTVIGNIIGEYQFGIPANLNPESGCDSPLNPIRTGIPLSAAQHRLARWIQYDELPPPNYFMYWEGDFKIKDDLFRPVVSWIRDDEGNALGGVRTPRIDVPLGVYSGSNSLEGPRSVPKILCSGIIGAFQPYTTEELEEKYTHRGVYIVLTWWNMWLSYLDGFLLPVDAKTIMDEAKAYEGLPAATN